MEHRFKADDWKTLTLAERTRHCLLWAAEAQELANRAFPELCPPYQSLADQWARLARELEQQGNGPSRCASSKSA